MSEMQKIDKMTERGREFLGTETAIICGAMSWISEHNLVSTVSNSGALGVLACGAMNVDQFREEIRKTKEKTSKNFGVNIILIHPEFDKMVDMFIEEKVSHIFFAAGIPSSSVVAKVKEHGIKTIAFAPLLTFAKRLVKNGIDALIVEGNEAGGHVGSLSTITLLQEVVPNIKEVPIFVAGGIASGSLVVNLLKMGASGVQIGTLFAATKESIAHQNFKDIFVKSSPRDTVQTTSLYSSFNVIPVRVIKNKALEEFYELQHSLFKDYKEGKINLEQAQLNIEHFWSGSLKRAVIDGDIEHGSLMAGQSVGFVKEILTVQEVIDKIKEEMQQAT